MNRLSKFFRLISECIGGILFELALLFSHSKMEQQDREQELDNEKLYLECEGLYTERITELKELLKSSENERRRLQDRLLQKNASMPIFEEPRETRSGEPQQAQTRDREKRVADRQKAAIKAQKKAIAEDVDMYLKENA
jgi:hypothetical protein